MKTESFYISLDEPLIIAEIARAEANSTGEVRIFIAEHPVPNPLPAAEREFHRLGMIRTRHRNAVLIFIAPESQTIAIVGDVALNAKVTADFWKSVVDRAVTQLARGRPTEALVDALRLIGNILRLHFPSATSNEDELPNTLARGG